MYNRYGKRNTEISGGDSVADGKGADKSAAKARRVIDIETEDRRERLKLILALTWPALAENVLATLVSMADTIMVSNLGEAAVAAVGLVTQPRFIVMSSFMALGIGTTALVARAKGRGDRDEARNAMCQSLLLALAIVVIVTGLMLAFAEPLIRMIAGDKNDEQAIVYAIQYFRVQIYGFPSLGLTFILTAALRGSGNTRAAFYANSAANIVNVIFNWFLIEGRWGFPRMEAEGASLATVLGQTVAFTFCLVLCLKKDQYCRIEKRFIRRVDIRMVERVAKIGLPAMAEQIIMRVGMLLFTMIAASLGTTLYSAHIVAMNIQSLSFTVGMSFGTASATLTGQSLGRRREDLARAYTGLTTRLCLVASVAVAVYLFFGGAQICTLYNVSEPEKIASVALVLRIVALSNPVSNTRFILNSSLRGAGDSKYTAWITLIGILVVRPVLAYLLVNFADLALTGVWIALVSDAFVCFALASYRWKSGKWAKIVV